MSINNHVSTERKVLEIPQSSAPYMWSKTRVRAIQYHKVNFSVSSGYLRLIFYVQFKDFQLHFMLVKSTLNLLFLQGVKVNSNRLSIYNCYAALLHAYDIKIRDLLYIIFMSCYSQRSPSSEDINTCPLNWTVVDIQCRIKLFKPFININLLLNNYQFACWKAPFSPW